MASNISVAHQKNADKDPLLQLGVGIYGYRSFLRHLIILFAILTVLSFPIIKIYQSGDGYSRQFCEKDSGVLKWSLGNMGFNSKRCAQQLLMSNKIHMTCTYGYLSKILPNGLGINLSVDGKTSDLCVAEISNENHKCNDFIDRSRVDILFDLYCKGKTSCNI